MSEFDLIRRHFTRATPGAVLGVGDDAALLRVTPGMELAVSTDMLVSGTHFYPDVPPYQLGYKTLAVNLSDLAAMGAQPRWATLALSLPEVDDGWLRSFSWGFFALAEQHGVELVGGDTTRGPLSLCVTIMGEVPQGQALRRDGAQVGDDIWVSGTLGEAALGLAYLQGRVELPEDESGFALQALHLPCPHIDLGLALRGVAHSAIDVSDGFLADLGHILAASGVAAEVAYDRLPGPSIIAAGQVSHGLAQECILSGGDDYELCFTAPVVHRERISALSGTLHLPLTRVGQIVSGQGCKVRAADGSVMRIAREGYDHFA
mgnify:CR=1 FL=1